MSLCVRVYNLMPLEQSSVSIIVPLTFSMKNVHIDIQPSVLNIMHVFPLALGCQVL